MTEQELLLDNLAYYIVDPSKRRCTGTNRCKYDPEVSDNPTTSEGCAIGRHLSHEAKRLYEEEEFASISSIFKKEELKSMAPEWMQNMSIEFLGEIQAIHDNFFNWNVDKGLTHAGKDYAKIIISKYRFDKKAFDKYLN